MRGGSWASRLFLAIAATVTVLGVVLALLLVLDAQRAAHAEAERVTRAVSTTIASMPEVAATLSEDDDPSAQLQPIAVATMDAADVDFITIMTPDGIRVTHRDPAQIGAEYLGTIPTDESGLTEEFTGTLGASVRTIEPILDDGQLVGWVSAGVTVESIASSFFPRLPFALAIALAVLAAGLVGAVLARRQTRRVAGDLAPGAVRDTLASYESVRTLGEALRAQTHEHGNRMHTAVALIELGRTDQAIEILTESSRQSQGLVDQVTARTEGDATVGALLLGKASQATERSIDWSAAIAPDAPHSVLSPIDQVALVGNLIDNAIDAASTGEIPRWVRVSLERMPGDRLGLVVSDSGDGIPAALREKVFERGFSTKPPGAAGRGVGLSLVRSIVTNAGGTIAIDEGAPTTIRVALPARSST